MLLRVFKLSVCFVVFFFFFFFKQKTAYEVLRGLVGSEMCIGDRSVPVPVPVSVCVCVCGCVCVWPPLCFD